MRTVGRSGGVLQSEPCCPGSFSVGSNMAAASHTVLLCELEEAHILGGEGGSYEGP